MPSARAGPEDHELVHAGAGPVLGHWEGTCLSKGPQAAVRPTVVQPPVAVEVQVPSARAGAEKPDLHIHWFSEGGGNRGVGKEGDRTEARATTAAPTPASKGGAGSGGGREGDRGAAGVELRAVGATSDARWGAAHRPITALCCSHRN